MDNRLYCNECCPHHKEEKPSLNDQSIITEQQSVKSIIYQEGIKTLGKFNNGTEIIDVPVDPDHPISWTFTTKPWQHQLAALQFIWHKKAAVLACAMRTGKTKISIDYIVNKGFRKVLIVCPKSVMDVWPDEFNKHSNKEYLQHLCYKLSQDGTDKKVKEMQRALNLFNSMKDKHKDLSVIIIVNYDSAKIPALADEILKAKFDLVILDECHKIKSSGSATAKFFYKLGKQNPYRLGLTGTLMADKPLDVYGQFKFFDPSIFGTNYKFFANEYAIFDNSGDYPRIIGYKNQDQLMQKVKRIAFFVENDVLDLPEQIDITRTFELAPATKKIYKEINKEFYTLLAEDSEVTIKNAGTKLLKLQQITSGFSRDDQQRDHDIDPCKRQLLKEILEEIDRREPLVIFARFSWDIFAIKYLLLEQGRTVSELSGQRDEKKVWQAGQSDVLVAQIQCGGAGLNLSRSNYIIYYSVGYSLTDYLQSRARILIDGKKQSCAYIHLLAKGTVDERVYQALSKKQDVITYMKQTMLEQQESL